MGPSKTDWNRLQERFGAYLRDDRLATHALFEELQAVLVPFFWMRTRSDAVSDDLTQATLLKIHFARDRFDPGLSLKTWVFTIARRVLIDHWRGLSSEDDPVSVDQDEAQSIPSGELDPSLKTELTRDLNQALESLKPNDRTIVYLSAVEGFSQAEIAELLGLTEGAVKVRAHRAHAQMRKWLAALTLAWITWKEFS